MDNKLVCFKQDSQDSYSWRKVTIKSYNVWIKDRTFLLVNYTGYHDKQQPADSAAFVDMWLHHKQFVQNHVHRYLGHNIP